MSWTEIVIELPRAQAEQVSDALIEAGALSVSVEDADQGTDAEHHIGGCDVLGAAGIQITDRERQRHQKNAAEEHTHPYREEESATHDRVCENQRQATAELLPE